MAENRPRPGEHAIYRIVPDREDGLALHLEDLSGRSFEGEISDLDAQGVSAFFDLGSAPALPVGLSIVVRLTSPHLDRPVEVSAMVVGRAEGDQRRRYGFQFQGDLLLTNARLRELVNRRGAYRVTSQPGVDIDVRISSIDADPRELAIGRLSDISGTGMGMLALADVDSELVHSERVEVSFTLPGSEGNIVMLAQIVTRVLEERFIRLGLRFDERRTPGYGAMQKRVFRYVMRRQQAELKRD